MAYNRYSRTDVQPGKRTLCFLYSFLCQKYEKYTNTHLAAICKIGDRLELQVRSLEMNGRIIPLALDAYDTDGLQGIYCPEPSASKNAKQASNDAISTAGTTFGGLVGDLASTVIRTGATIAKSASGELSVSVVSGYEFYLVKAERR